jgi:uncharacterized protein YbjT (DUF2867 family)
VTIAVTTPTGNVGSHVVRMLCHAGVRPRLLLRNLDRLDAQTRDHAAAVPHSPVLTAIQAWLIVVADPDDNRLRLYTLQNHGPELPPSHDPWLGS